MYYQIISNGENKTRIVANNNDDAKMIGHELYPNDKLTIVQITHEQFHENVH